MGAPFHGTRAFGVFISVGVSVRLRSSVVAVSADSILPFTVASSAQLTFGDDSHFLSYNPRSSVALFVFFFFFNLHHSFGLSLHSFRLGRRSG